MLGRYTTGPVAARAEHSRGARPVVRLRVARHVGPCARVPMRDGGASRGARPIDSCRAYTRPMALIDLRSDTVTQPVPGDAPGDGRGRGRRRRLRRRPDGQRPRGTRRRAPRQGGRPVRRVRDDGQPRRPDGAPRRAARRRSPAASTTSSSTRRPATPSSSAPASARSRTGPTARWTRPRSTPPSATRPTPTSRSPASSPSRTPTPTRWASR